jgi:hypothetical protein
MTPARTEAESARVEQPPAKQVKLETVTEQELPNVSSVGINHHWPLT